MADTPFDPDVFDSDVFDAEPWSPVARPDDRYTTVITNSETETE